MRIAAFIAAFIVVLAGLAGIVYAVQRFNQHQGLPSHIDIGSRYGHVVPGEADIILGHALDTKPGTKLLLAAQLAPYNRTRWRVIASFSQLGPGGSFSFVVRPRARTRYKVMAAIDHFDSSRYTGSIVDRTR